MYLFGKNLFNLELQLNQQFHDLHLQDFQAVLYLK